jgi:DUF971 family protein
MPRDEVQVTNLQRDHAARLYYVTFSDGVQVNISDEMIRAAAPAGHRDGNDSWQAIQLAYRTHREQIPTGVAE